MELEIDQVNCNWCATPIGTLIFDREGYLTACDPVLTCSDECTTAWVADWNEMEQMDLE